MALDVRKMEKKMKTCVVTVYNSDNYGAFMQAYSMQEFLKSQGCDVYFLKNKARNLNMLTIKKIVKRITKANFRGFGYQLARRKQFVKANAVFKECSFEETKDMQLAVLGSDEIWNIKRKSIYSYPSFFGKDVNAKAVISYAPSANLAGKSDFMKHPEIIETMKSIDALSVRDEHSKEVISQLFEGKSVDVVVDPTLLNDETFYRKNIVKCPEKDKFIAIYSYGNKLSRENIDNIVKFAHNNGYKIISLLDSFSWCDKNVALSPFETLGYFDAAQMVFTDTFHGSIFSIILNKKLIVTSKSSNKIYNLLCQFGLDNRIISKDATIEKLADTEIDYESVNGKVSVGREFSRTWLKDKLERFNK